MESDVIGTDKAPLPLHERQPITSLQHNPETQESPGGKLRFQVIVVILLLVLVGVSALVWTLIMDSSAPAPALKLEPRLENAVDSRRIWVKRSDSKRSNSYGDRITQFFHQEYFLDNEQVPPWINCSYGGDAAAYETACMLDVTGLNRGCSKENSNYGYDQGTPCVLLRLDKIVAWTPEAYKTETDLELAKERGMPSDLLKEIRGFLSRSSVHPYLDTIWMSCEGEVPADRENIGPLQYFSLAFKHSEFQGVPAYYFPYLKQKAYKAPFIFVKFVEPQHNVVIQVTCRAWAKNIGPQNPLGKVQFDLRID